ncbi:HAD-IIIA family hydrolase [Candidatus Daviesbacteria bacterium]|nr:HAD-IIIA family hydrolase [Candidatus Daviesbacteria bacterium]
MEKRALFIDRDGVINQMIRYENGWDSPQKLTDVKLVEGIGEVILWANIHKIPVIEISNQPGVAKGKMSQKVSDAIEEKVHKLVKKKGAFINRAYVCYHHPKAVIKKFKEICDCRKPKPGLLLQAAKDLKIDLEQSVMLGDKISDAEAGRASGCKTIIFVHDNDTEDKAGEAKKAKADYRVFKISEITPLLKRLFNINQSRDF